MNPPARSAHALPIPGLRWGSYPQRPDDARGAAPRRSASQPGLLPGWLRHGAVAARFAGHDGATRVARIQARARGWQALDGPAFGRLRRPVQVRFARDGMTAGAIDAAAAYAVETARRTLGRSAYDGQVQAAIAMTDNVLVEMATGEGKSLATALAAAIAGLAGIPVHVLTANDYLVARDAAFFEPLFRALGLTAATVLAATAAPARRSAYAGPIVYATAREVAFDYLRDRLGQPGRGQDGALINRLHQAIDPAGAPLMRGLCMAIIDEADSVLIDEAQMPLVLSREQRDPGAHAALCQAWMLSARLTMDVDFTVLEGERSVRLEPAGQQNLERLAAPLAAAWKNRLHREQLVLSALTARHALRRDRDYLVSDGVAPEGPRIELIDIVTGRIAVGRRWSAGIHALVAIKEGLKPEADLETLDRITFQRFFRRYHRLGGSSGTLAEARTELRQIYGLSIVTVAPRLPLRREHWPTRCFAGRAARDQAIVARARELAGRGRPVLVGTDSVADTRRLSAALDAAGIAHGVLDARFDAEEAALIARAGEAGRITVSTNMAGRGTDIELSPAAREAGGLHVLLCQHNASHRLDRQLAGRAGRQGDPGSCETWLVLEPRGAAALAPLVSGDEIRLPASALDQLHRAGQRVREQRLRRRRAALLREDQALQQSLSFAGPS